MNVERYFKSLGSEFTAIKNRVRDFIDDRHWLTDGEWKESVLRSFLRNICPESFLIGRGFVITEDKPTPQIDILIYNNKSLVLFKDNDLVFLPTKDISIILEVKTKLTRSNIDDAINHLKNTFNIIKPYRAPQMLYGLFSYEINENLTTIILDKLKQAHSDMNESFIQLLCLGSDHLIKYWEQDPNDEIHGSYNKWHLYELHDMAYGYFTHNIVTHLNPYYQIWQSKLFFPKESKEIHKIGEIELGRNT